jgi:hypothetical protein
MWALLIGTLIATAPVPVKTVFNDYHRNEIKADLKYRDRETLIKGTVVHIGRNDKGKALLMIASTSLPDWVLVCFPQDESKIAALDQGKDVIATVKIARLFFEKDTHVLKLFECKL